MKKDFNWKIYKELNPYLYITGLRTEQEYTSNYFMEGKYKGRIYKYEQQKKYSLHVLMATIGKKSIFNILSMLKTQLNEIDFLTIVFDGLENSKNAPYIQSFCKDFKCKVNIIIEQQNLGYWGHGIRNKHNNLEGDFIYHIDDDDILYDDSFNNIRKYAVDTDIIYIFKIMTEKGGIIWKNPLLEYSKVSTQSGVIPSQINKKGYWALKYGGDFDFYNNLSKEYEMIFIDKLIYKKQ
jgi:hypothetical protein